MSDSEWIECRHCYYEKQGYTDFAPQAGDKLCENYSKIPKKFGILRLSVKGTNNGNGFDILYDFGKSYHFVEFESKREFYFIQPWMQFPSREYTDECMRVSIELVHRFNAYDRLLEENKNLRDLFEAKEKEKLNTPGV